MLRILNLRPASKYPNHKKVLSRGVPSKIVHAKYRKNERVVSPRENPSFSISRVMAEEKKDFQGKWLAVGIAIGMLIGMLMGNIPLGICIGAGLGTAAALNEKKKKDKEEK